MRWVRVCEGCGWQVIRTDSSDPYCCLQMITSRLNADWWAVLWARALAMGWGLAVAWSLDAFGGFNFLQA
jgi:hypothetical protein